MAIHLPSNLYSEGQVPLNSNAFTQFYLQEKSKQRARKDAFDSYYRDMGKGLTPAGMAPNDIPGFMNRIQGWKQYTLQNRDILNDPRNPKYAEAVTQSQYLYNDALEHAETSKSKVKDAYQARQLQKPDHPLTDASMKVYGDALAPLDEGYVPMDFSKLEYDEKPYDYIAQQKDIKAALGGVQPLGKTVTNIKPDPRTHTNTVTYDFEYNKDALNNIAQKGAAAYQQNDKIAKFVDANYADKEHYDFLNEPFEKAYGRPIENGADKYTALLLINAKQPYEQQAVSHFNQHEGEGGSGGAAGAATVNNVYKDINQRVDTDLSNGYGATRINALNTDAQNVIIDFIRKTTGGDDLNYSNTFLAKDKDGNIGIYKTHLKDGAEKLNIEPKYLIGVLPQVGTNLKVQPSVQEKRKVLNEGEQKTLPPKKDVKKSDNDPMDIR